MPWAGPATLTEPTTLPAADRAAVAQRSPRAHAPGRCRSRLRTRAAACPVSATLAANEALESRRQRGEPVLPLAFGESGLPVHPLLTAELADTAGLGAYGPVAGTERLREAAAGYWSRRSLPTDPGAVVAGPGSKALLFGTLLALGTDIAVPRPSWVSYAAQATLIGAAPHFVPAVPGEGGICDAAALEAAVRASRAAGRPIGAVLVTMPDNPTGRLASPAAVRELCAAAERNDLVIISDEIYRDLVHDPSTPVPQPGGRGAGAHRRDDGAEQESGRRRLAYRSGQDARRQGRHHPAGPATRHRQRDLVRRCRPGAARRRGRARGACRPDRADHPQPSRCTQRSAMRLPALAPQPGSMSPRRRPPSTCTRTSPRGGTTCAASSGSAPAPTWPRCCSTGTERAHYPAAPSASARRHCGCGSRPACSTATPTSSASRRSPRPTRSPCRGSALP